MTDTLTDEEIVQLARQAGLVLPAEYVPELIEAYGHVRRMIGRIPTARPHSEPAHVFVPSVSGGSPTSTASSTASSH
jgi:hypothetical protein